jgi:hypothetical protein
LGRIKKPAPNPTSNLSQVQIESLPIIATSLLYVLLGRYPPSPLSV